ncbi:MAG: MotA/TolQ/ExbB proton channel family protein [Elusimicrobiales bacterium]|nr:MotA/TolQ/ExbB proton channel family protein [Elusimicrobiales bacterium]
MDSASVLGLLIGVACVWFAMVSGDIVGLLWNLPSFVLVFGGTIASTMMTFPMSVIKDVPRSLFLTFFPQKIGKPQTIIDRLCKLADIVKEKGVDSLAESTIKDDKFLKSGVKMVLSDWEEDDIKESLEKDLEFTLERHQQVQKAFAAAGGYGPVFGLLGTLIGILGVLRYLDSPKAMGAAMTVAIVTTFYGIFLANFIALPAAGKLETYSSKELLAKQLMLMGVIAFKREEPSLMLRRKLEKHLAAHARKEEK